MRCFVLRSAIVALVLGGLTAVGIAAPYMEVAVTSPGQVSQPGAMAADGFGNVYVANPTQLIQFNGGMKYGNGALATGQTFSYPGYSPTGTNAFYGVAIDTSQGSNWGNNYIWSVDQNNSGGGAYAWNFNNTGYQAAPDYNVWVGAANNMWNYNGANGIAVDSSGSLWVIAAGSGGGGQEPLWYFGGGGGFYPNGGGQAVNNIGGPDLNNPSGVAVNANDNAWVTNTGNNTIDEYNIAAGGAGSYAYPGYVKSIGSGLNGPTGISVDSKGDIWVADSGNNRIVEYNSNGNLLTSFGSLGSGSGQFNDPDGVCVDSNGNVWVADYGNNRLVEFARPLHSGDANGDGRVHINDLTVVLANYGKTAAVWSQGEFTGDGTVDINDLTIVLANYDYGVSAAGPSPVPEPTGLMLAATGAVGLLAYGRWRRRTR